MTLPKYLPLFRFFPVPFFVILTFLFVMPAVADVPKPQGDERDEIINSELQAAAEREKVTADDQTQENLKEIQENIGSDMDAQAGNTMPDQEMVDTSSDGLSDQEPSVSGRKPRGKFELGTEYYTYKYTEVIGVKVTGKKGGLVGSYTSRPWENQRIKSFKDIFSGKNKINMFKVEGRLSYGAVDYSGSGTWGGIPDWNFEGRVLVGDDIPVMSATRLTPYLGFGYRHLFNKFSVAPARNVEGIDYSSGYDRLSNYFYIPVGLEAETHLTSHWSLGLKSEFDFFLWGKQISKLDKSVDKNDVNAGFPRVNNDQKKGLGWRASARLTRESEKFDIFAEPFFRYWHISDSVADNGFYEPNNKTWECGINTGVKF